MAGTNLASHYGKLEIIRVFSTETTRKSSMVRKLRQSSFRRYSLGGAVFRVAYTSAQLIQGITFEKARRATNRSPKNDDLEPRERFVL